MTLKSSGHVSPVLECDGLVVKDAAARATCFNNVLLRKD